MEYVIKIIEYFGGPTFLLVFLLIAAMIFFSFKAGSIIEKIKSIDKVNESIGDIKEDMHEVRGTIRLINSRLDSFTGGNSFAERHSPIRLTEKGESLLSRTIKSYIDSSFDDILSDYKEIEELTNPFDIEEFAKKIAAEVYDKYTSENDKDKIKKELFFDGATMNDFYLITWIYLRDKFLNMKGIDIEKLDEKTK